MNNGPDHRNRADMRTALRVHPEEEIGQPPREERPLVPPPSPQQGVRGGRTAIEDTLGEWLNGNHQAELRELQERYRTCYDELRIVYDAWQYEFRQNTRLLTSLQQARATGAQYEGVVERIFAEFPEVGERFELQMRNDSEVSTVIDLTDEEVREIIDLTMESDDEMESEEFFGATL